MEEITIRPKTFAYIGMVAALFYPVTWFISAMLDGNWSMWNQAISDLGVSHSMAATVVFNISMIGSGLFALIFGFGKVMCEKRLDRLSGLALMVAGPFLIGVGIVNEDMGQVHMFTASTYGVATATAIGISIAADLYYKKWVFAIASLILGIIGLVMMPMKFEVFEPIGTIVGTVWMFVQGIKMYLYGTESKIKVERTAPSGQ